MNYESKFKNIAIFTLITGLIFIAPLSVSAHVGVKPNQAGVGSYQTFTIGVPNEKDNPTIGLRLVIPEGLEHVSPNVKPGWSIGTKHSEDMDNGNESGHNEATVTEVTWTGGSIPEGQRDDFLFSAKVPAEPSELIWKAYQTYSDGTVIAWDLAADQQPKNAEGEPDFSVSGPYSVTKVVNDLTSPKPATETVLSDGGKSNNLPLILSALAVILSGICFWRTFRKK